MANPSDPADIAEATLSAIIHRANDGAPGTSKLDDVRRLASEGLAALRAACGPGPEKDADLPAANDVRGILKQPGSQATGATDLRASVIAAVLEHVAREIPCGQAPEASSDHPCKKTWGPYNQNCPECALHHADRGEFAAAIADAVLPIALSAMNSPAADDAPATVVLPFAHQIEAVGLILGLYQITGADNVRVAAERLAAYLPQAHRPDVSKVPVAIEYAQAIDEHRAAAIDLANLGPQAHESRRETARKRYYAAVQALHRATAAARAKAGMPEPQWVDRLIAEADDRHRQSGLHSSFYQGVATALRQYREPAPADDVVQDSSKE